MLSEEFEMNTPIHSFLEEYSAKNPVRCHMPGGKGRNSPFDITEIHGADSLFESDGIIYESEKNAASLFGAGATLFPAAAALLQFRVCSAHFGRQPKKIRL